MAPGKCTSANCKAEIYRVVNMRNTTVPLDAKPFAEKGAAVPANLTGLYVIASDDRCHPAQADLDLVVDGKLTKSLHLNHWVTCKDRDNWRQRVAAQKKTAKK